LKRKDVLLEVLRAHAGGVRSFAELDAIAGMIDVLRAAHEQADTANKLVAPGGACLAGGLDGDPDELSTRAGLDEREPKVDG